MRIHHKTWREVLSFRVLHRQPWLDQLLSLPRAFGVGLILFLVNNLLYFLWGMISLARRSLRVEKYFFVANCINNNIINLYLKLNFIRFIYQNRGYERFLSLDFYLLFIHILHINLCFMKKLWLSYTFLSLYALWKLFV
jgi:hypothetical protein